MRPVATVQMSGFVGYSARVSAATTSQADETVRQAAGSPGDVATAAVEALAVLTGIAVGGLLRPATAGRLLRPPGRVLILAALFALAGAFDWGIQSHFGEVAPTIVWIAVIVGSVLISAMYWIGRGRNP